MTDRPFVHLHCHSHYSLLDGAASIDKLIDRAVERGMNALALTDHGNLHGALEFYQKAKKAGINPIVGYEAYIAPGHRTQKAIEGVRETSYHLTLLAQNRTGFDNLLKMSSAAYLEGFYRKPRIDKELLEAHHEGLVCLSGCASGELSRSLLRNRGTAEWLGEPLEIAQWFHKLFGDRYFIEIQNNGAEIQQLSMEGSLEVANRLGLPLVATSDAHYADQEDAESQDVMLCINTGRFRTDTTRMKMDGDQYFLRSPEQMYEAFPDHADAVARSQEIANSVDLEIELGKRYFPVYDTPDNKSAEDYLRELCIEGLKDRYAGDEEMLPGGELSQVVMDRLDRELGVINQLGFPNYFLIVWDFVRESRELDIPTTARGSGVGALVCFALYMSHVCPIEYDLLFERFLDPSRLEAPDIDIDFCKERRGEMIRYVKDKYGEENVAQIGTFGTLAARAAIKDVGRALGIPLARVNQVTGMVPDVLNIKLSKALETSEELRKTYEQDGEIRELLDLAQKIEGLARNVGTHAAAVVIGDKPLDNYVPLGKVSGKTDIITQWSMNDVEAAGLLKMDFLGLRNLTILSKAVGLIEQTTGETVDPYKFPLDDKETFALLCRGETKGIFQLESGGIRDLLQRMKPDRFLDIIATNALYRPGPLEGGMVDKYVAVKHGEEEAEYLHDVLKDVLEETNGVMVYQEQVMRILNRLGGIELAKAYTCIKAISKKKEDKIQQFYEQFIEGATDKGLKKEEAKGLWELIIKFAGYGFNKSHSTAYALIAYMTAYLKAHFPLEFMAALLTGDIPGRNFKRKDALVEHMEDCERMEIEVVAPHVNTSGVDFTVGDGKIYYALSAIKGCGNSATAIEEERKNNGPFSDIFDFCERIEPSSCNKATLESLVKAGGFDAEGINRAQLTAVIEKAMQCGAAKIADKRAGQKSLFGGMESEEEQDAPAVQMPDIEEFPEREKLMMEKEVLGFYLESHPLAEYEQMLSTYCSHTTNRLGELKERQEVFVGGMLSSIKMSHVKKAKSPTAPTKFANFDLEDMEGAVRCILWPDDFVTYGDFVQADAVVVARAKVDRRGGGDEVNLVVNELIPLEQLDTKYTQGVCIRVDEVEHGDKGLKQLHEILRGYPGNQPLQLVLQLGDGSKAALTSQSIRIDVDPEMRSRVDDLLGPGNFRLLIKPPKPSEDTGRRYAKRN